MKHTLEDGLEASTLRATPRSCSISSFFKPLPSKKAIFLSVVASFTSSSSRNFFALSISSVLDGSSVALVSTFPSLFFSSSAGACRCHDGTPDFGFVSESLMVLDVLCRNEEELR